MNVSLNLIDAIFFDMDGTLWNASDSYAEVWNIALSLFGKKGHFTGSDMHPYMGMAIEDIMTGLLSEYEGLDHQEFLAKAMQIEVDLMPVRGGVLYPGVFDGLEKLSRHYKLFMMSNCGPTGLVNFMSFTKTRPFFIDSLTYGENPAPKSVNIQHLVMKHHLQHAVYVGDTQADCDESHKAGLPFVHAAYGFGQCNDPEWRITSFGDFVSLFLEQYQ